MLTYWSTSPDARRNWAHFRQDYRILLDDDGVEQEVRHRICRVLAIKDPVKPGDNGVKMSSNRCQSSSSRLVTVQWSGYGAREKDLSTHWESHVMKHCPEGYELYLREQAAAKQNKGKNMESCENDLDRLMSF